jgi:hypothetical protein
MKIWSEELRMSRVEALGVSLGEVSGWMDGWMDAMVLNGCMDVWMRECVDMWM